MKKYGYIILGILAAILYYNAHAWVAAGRNGVAYGHGRTVYGHTGYYRSHYYHGSYYYDGWSAHGMVVGVPAGVYYGYGCGWVQTCGHTGCVTEHVCE